MPHMTDRQSVAANTTIANALAGKTAEFLQEDSIVRLYAQASAVGMNVSLIVGGEISVEDQEVGAQNRMPLVPDDLIAEVGGFASDRIVVKLHNTTGGAITSFIRVDTEPV